MRRLVAILNPQADRGHTGQIAESFRATLGRRFELRLAETNARGQAIALAHAAAEQGCDAVIAIGGDGTVHEVVQGLMAVATDARPALGILPAGSGNDVAFALGITKDLRRSVDMIEQGATRLVDIGEVRASSGQTRYCINNIGLLLEGEINRVSHRLTWPRGSGLYIRAMLQTLLRRLPRAELQMSVDGRELSRRATMLSIGNGPRSGGKFQLMPDAAIDDGRFDYILVPPVNRLKLLWNVRHALAGRRLEGDWLERGRFGRLTLESDVALVAHVDGEPWLASGDNAHALDVNVLPRALAVIGPAAA